ncbi:hypothetical protein AB0J52_09050 [Spirillospora sp. NPDC049652]
MSEDPRVPALLGPLARLGVYFIVMGVIILLMAVLTWTGIAKGDWGLATGCTIIAFGLFLVGGYFIRGARRLRKETEGKGRSSR